METRANYVAVGAFVVILLLGAAGVMLWVLGGQFNAKQAFFHMSFAGSVAGLTKDSAVRYNGVPVGKVTEIVIDKEHPNHVTVVVALEPSTQIRHDAVASLATQGLTGGSYIEIGGGTPASPPFVNEFEPRGPLINSRATGGLQSVFDRAPEVIDKFLAIEDQLHDILGGKNRVAIDQVIENIRKLSAVLANHSGDVEEILANTADASKKIDQLAATANQVVQKAGGVVDHVDTTVGHVNTAVGHVDKLIGHTDKLVGNVDGTVTDVRPGLRDLSQRGVRQIEQLVTNLNDVVTKIGRVVDELERNPSKFLFGDHNEGYQPK
jgi:phospholipid/cholesterol/gamma-HCH transport system substrate-binding protein